MSSLDFFLSPILSVKTENPELLCSFQLNAEIFWLDILYFLKFYISVSLKASRILGTKFRCCIEIIVGCTHCNTSKKYISTKIYVDLVPGQDGRNKIRVNSALYLGLSQTKGLMPSLENSVSLPPGQFGVLKLRNIVLM